MKNLKKFENFINEDFNENELFSSDLEEDGDESILNKIHKAIYGNDSESGDFTMGDWLEELSDGDLEILYSMLISTGKIESEY